MTPSQLVLLGAFDTLIAVIQSERERLGHSFDPEAAVQTLQKMKGELTRQLLASARAQLLAGETWRSTADLLLMGLPQGSDTERLIRSLQHTLVGFLPEGPTPAWPSSSSSKNPYGLALDQHLEEILERLRSLTNLGPSR